MCKECSTAWCKPGCTCYGCGLRAKNLSISGETVSGWTFGRKPLLLTDKAIDQRLEAGNQIKDMSTQMQQGGAVKEDRLQQPIQEQYARVKAASIAEGIKPVHARTTTGIEGVGETYV